MTQSIVYLNPTSLCVSHAGISESHLAPSDFNLGRCFDIAATGDLDLSRQSYVSLIETRLFLFLSLSL